MWLKVELRDQSEMDDCGEPGPINQQLPGDTSPLRFWIYLTQLSAVKIQSESWRVEM